MTTNTNLKSDIRYWYDTLREVKSVLSEEIPDREQVMYLLEEVDQCLCLLEDLL